MLEYTKEARELLKFLSFEYFISEEDQNSVLQNYYTNTVLQPSTMLSRRLCISIASSVLTLYYRRTWMSCPVLLPGSYAPLPQRRTLSIHSCSTGESSHKDTRTCPKFADGNSICIVVFSSGWRRQALKLEQPLWVSTRNCTWTSAPTLV
jgi:hypothetical protein